MFLMSIIAAVMTAGRNKETYPAKNEISCGIVKKDNYFGKSDIIYETGLSCKT